MNTDTQKTLKEIAQITFDTYGMPGEDDSLALQASIDAFELYGYDPLSYAEIAELEKHCDLVLGLADIEAEDEVDEDSREGRHEMRLDYCNDDPERAAEIWGDYEDDCAEALSKIKVLEAEITLLKGSLTEVVEAQGHLIEPSIAVMLGFEADEYLWYLGENDYEGYFTDALMIEFNEAVAKRTGGA